MLLVLKIILVIVLIGFAVVVIGVWWFINRVKTALKEALSGANLAPPCRITLQPESHPEWRNAEKMKQYSDDFTANGFTSLGAFQVPEVSGLKIEAFVNEAESLFGVTYDHEKIPTSFNVVCRYEDGSDLTVTDLNEPATLDRPPNSPIIRLAGIDVKGAVDAAAKHPATAPRLPAKAADFVSRFELAFAQEADWRMRRGGPTREEVRRRAELGGKTISEEKLYEAHASIRSAWMMQLQVTNVNQYKIDQNIAQAEWKKMEYRVFAIPMVLTEKEVYEQLEANLGLEEKQMVELRKIKLAPGQTALDLINEVLAGKAGQLPMKRLGSVKEPVPAEILLSEVTEDDSDDDSDESEEEAQHKA